MVLGRQIARTAGRLGRDKPPRASARRRGMAALMAMMLMAVFAVLAIGFYASVNMASQIAANERRGAAAMAAADSGLAFVRYQLAHLAAEHVPEEHLLVEVAHGLAALMNDTGNLGYGAQEVGMSPGLDAILIPKAGGAMVRLGDGSGFRCKITRSGRSLVVKVAGYSGTASSEPAKGVEYTFDAKQIPAPLFDYGVASVGPVTVDNKVSIGGSPATLGSVLTTATVNPVLTMVGNASVSGEVSMTHPAGAVDMSADASVAGKTGPVAAAPHIRKVTGQVDFPVMDTSVFWPYVLKPDGTPNFYDAATMGNSMTNVVVPPGSYSFNSGVTIKGVVYLQTPCSIKFNGSATIQGAIVVENNAKGTLAQNALEFQGGVSFTGIDTLPDTPAFPAGLRALSGTMIAAEGASVEFGGGFGTVAASIFASQVTFRGNAEGTVAGSIVGLAANPMLFTSRPITIQEQKGDRWPAGTNFRSSYALQAGTYREFSPASEGLGH